MDEALRYPIGKFVYAGLASAAECAERARALRDFPWELREAVAGLSDAQLDTPYREGGWTARQVVHHLGDGSLHFFCRTMTTMTEADPHVIGFEENDWIKMPDHAISVEATLAMLDGIHARWDALLTSMKHEDYARTFMHSDNGETVLDQQIVYAAWHCKHHTAHITSLRKRMGW
ncbi:MAG: putative metal-dependent hydrolase [Calditrichaeota bacterium]|nr:putative metal-dependent hydrolase [Calditrichota bacterium]MCB9369356.1 putative metal-dependent hydrolase [Calditrichota bacterium]